MRFERWALSSKGRCPHICPSSLWEEWLVPFLQIFFANTTHDIELRTVPMVAREFSRDPKTLAAFLIKQKASNLYFGCCTREGKQGAKVNCRELVAFWVDIDFKELPEAEARYELDTFALRPTLIISSGGGFHVYWCLKQPYDAQDSRCEAILKGLALTLHADTQACDISRILRVPDTLNHKYKPPREVKLIHADWSTRYDIDDFKVYEQHIEQVKPVEQRNGQVTKGGRTKAINSLAGFMNRNGNTLEEIEAACLGLNTRFDPPFTEKEVRRKAQGIFNGYAKEHGNGDAPTNSRIECVLADSIEPEPLLWLWENRIPLGKLTVFCGVPDTGKSTVAIDIASKCTTGFPWPDCPNRHDPCDVLMLISEDDLKDTVVPRLIASGAKLNHIHFAIQTIVEKDARRTERRIALDADLKALESILVQEPEIKLVIIDPLGSYLGALKKNDEEVIRRVLTDMKELAERTGVSMVSIDHFNKKNEQSAIHRLSGAGALAAVPRAVWAFVKDTDSEDKTMRLMLNAKLNVVSEAKKAGLKYYATGVDIAIKGVQSNLPVIQWLGNSDGDLDEILHKQADHEGTKANKCGKWLLAELAHGARWSEEIYKAGEKLGFSDRTIKRVRSDLGIKPLQVGRRWKMELPGGENDPRVDD
jgi:putative DNA primase/helicase